MNCPICNKGGLQRETTVCPQCNSDLSSFAIIESIKDSVNKKQSNKKWIFLIVGLCLCFSIFYWYAPRTITKTIELVKEVKNDSTEYYKSVIVSLKQNAEEEKSSVIKYIVKSGDNLGKISKENFNDYQHIQKIAKDNNLQDANFIVVGSTIFIDLSEKK